MSPRRQIVPEDKEWLKLCRRYLLSGARTDLLRRQVHEYAQRVGAEDAEVWVLLAKLSLKAEATFGDYDLGQKPKEPVPGVEP